MYICVAYDYRLLCCSTIYLRSVGLTSHEKNYRKKYNWVTKKNHLKLQCIFFWLFVCIEVRNQSNISVLVTALQYISGLSNSHLMKRIKDRNIIEWQRKICWKKKSVEITMHICLFVCFSSQQELTLTVLLYNISPVGRTHISWKESKTEIKLSDKDKSKTNLTGFQYQFQILKSNFSVCHCAAIQISH